MAKDLTKELVAKKATATLEALGVKGVESEIEDRGDDMQFIGLSFLKDGETVHLGAGVQFPVSEEDLNTFLGTIETEAKKVL